MENRLIHVGKINSKTTQKRGSKIFTRQLGERIYQQQCWQKAKRCIMLEDDEADNSSIGSSSTNISNLTQEIHEKNETSFAKTNHDYAIKLLNNGYTQIIWKTKTPAIITDSVRFKMSKFMKNKSLSVVLMHTEIKHKNEIYRAHPNYRAAGHWYDWCMVRYSLSEDDDLRRQYNIQHSITTAYPVGHYPAKIMVFFGILKKFIA